jgi:hypothetical protein
MCAAYQVDSFLKLVLLSACSSFATAEAFFNAGVRNVVGLRSKITDRAAQVFTRAFYFSLLLGNPVGQAFEIAR